MKVELASEALRAIPSFALKRKSHGFEFVQRRVRDSNAIFKIQTNCSIIMGLRVEYLEAQIIYIMSFNLASGEAFLFKMISLTTLSNSQQKRLLS